MSASAPDRRRPRPKREPDPAAAEDERRERGIREPLDVAVIETFPHLAVAVRNPVHRTRYVVHLPAYPTREGALCSCPDFAHRGIGMCKHIEAALPRLDGRPRERELPRRGLPDPRALWERIDAVPRPTRLSAASLRAAGRLHFESA